MEASCLTFVTIWNLKHALRACSVMPRLLHLMLLKWWRYVFQISVRPVITSILNRSAEFLGSVGSAVYPYHLHKMCQSSTHLLFALHIKPGVNCIACLQQWRTCITPDYLPGIKISQCIPNCKTRVTASTCVTVFAFLLHLISICGCVIDRMPSGENNSGISINNEWYMRTEASNVPMYLPLSCLLWTLLFEPCWESIRAPSGL